MWIEQRFYWFFDPEWWISATQGIWGALIGFTALYVVFRSTKNHELDLQKKAHDIEQKRREDDRTAERVGAIIQACLSMEPSRFNRELTDFNTLIRLLVLFFAHESRRHPNMADWAYQQAKELARRIRAGDLQVPFRHSVGMVGDFSAWITHGLTDDVSAHFNKTKIKELWEEAENEVDSSLAVTWDDLRSNDPEVQEEVRRRLELWSL